MELLFGARRARAGSHAARATHGGRMEIIIGVGAAVVTGIALTCAILVARFVADWLEDRRWRTFECPVTKQPARVRQATLVEDSYRGRTFTWWQCPVCGGGEVHAEMEGSNEKAGARIAG